MDKCIDINVFFLILKLDISILWNEMDKQWKILKALHRNRKWCSKNLVSLYSFIVCEPNNIQKVTECRDPQKVPKNSFRSMLRGTDVGLEAKKSLWDLLSDFQ